MILEHVQLTGPPGCEPQARVGVEDPFTPARKAHPGFRVDPQELDRLASRLGARRRGSPSAL